MGGRQAGLETRDTADSEVCATPGGRPTVLHDPFTVQSLNERPLGRSATVSDTSRNPASQKTCRVDQAHRMVIVAALGFQPRAGTIGHLLAVGICVS